MYRCEQVPLEARGFRFPGAGASWSFRQYLDSGALQEQGMFNHQNISSAPTEPTIHGKAYSGTADMTWLLEYLPSVHQVS